MAPGLPADDHRLHLGRGREPADFRLALRKETLRRRGAIASAKARDPGLWMDARDHAEMDGLLGRVRQKLIAAERPLPAGL